MIIRTIIVDDEPLAIRRTKRLLGEIPDVEIVAECSSGIEAVESVRLLKPQLLMLDIEMPGGNGFELVAALKQLPETRLPEFIFQTAYPDYALRAFEVAAIDYVLKPMSRSRLHESIARLRARLSAMASPVVSDETTDLQRIPVHRNGKTVFIDPEDVEWIEAAGNYVVIHLENAREIVRDTLGSFEEKLSDKHFHRISRSALVRLAAVREVRKTEAHEHVAVTGTGTELVITRDFRELMRRISAGA